MKFGEYKEEVAAKAAPQKRGICQICGREQAVRDKGNITHHGYTIKFGWFQGTCPGQQHQPLQFDKSETERQIKNIEKELPKIAEKIGKLKAGKIWPLKVNTDRSERVDGKFRPIVIDWADASEYHRERAMKSAIFAEERRYKAGADTITFLKELIEKYYMKELKVIERAGPKPQIVVGSVINVSGNKGVTVTAIREKRASGVGPSLNGQYLDHVFWEVNGREYSYPKRLAKLA